MKTIERNTIAACHEAAISLILRDGIEIMTKHGMTIEYPEPITIKILHPFEEPRVSSASSFLSHMADYYANQLLNVIPKKGDSKDFDYNCGNRWFDYPQIHNGNIIGDGDNYGFDQIAENVVAELKKDRSSRRAIVCSINPIIDYSKKHIPCISFLQFLIRDNQLNMFVYIRSNDMLSAWGADAYALSRVLQFVGKKLDTPTGYLEMISVSAHIYFKRDEMELQKFRRKINF